MSKVILQGHIIVPDDDLEVVQEELKIHRELTLKEPGCLAFEVFQDTKNQNKFNVYEEFTDQRAFDSHQKRTKNSKWEKVTRNVQRQYQISNN